MMKVACVFIVGPYQGILDAIAKMRSVKTNVHSEYWVIT